MDVASPSELLRYPAIGGTCAIALGLYAAVPPEALEPLQLDLRALGPEPWRLLTSTLLHAGQLQSEDMISGLAHVGFNCYWLWLLGTQIERRLGHLRTLALLILFAVGGSLFEYAMSGAAVGLSGVVYGMVAMLAVLSRKHRDWRGTLDDRTGKFFGFWFGLCIALTLADAFPVANFAHAGGALLGFGVGLAITGNGGKRLLASAGVVATLALFVVGATVARPHVNFSRRAGLDAMLLAERADRAGELDRAVAWAERGVGYRRTPADHWAYLGGLYYRSGRVHDARRAVAEAVARAPEDAGYRSALEQLEALAEPTGH